MPYRATLGESFEIPPSETDLAYLAGILDGEGCFKVGSGSSRIAGLDVRMCDAGTVEWLKATFGGITYTERSSTNRTVYGWRLHRQADLLYVLPRVAPYLQIKAPQAWAMLRVVETLRAQPRYKARARTQEERVHRRVLRERWNFDVALAKASVPEARQVLKDVNPLSLPAAT